MPEVEVNEPAPKKKKSTNIFASFVSSLKNRLRSLWKTDDSDKKRPRIVLIAACLIIILGIVLGSYFLFVKSDSPKSSQGLTASADWVSYKDERGFGVQTPKDWKVSVNDWGLIKIGPNPEKTDQQTVFALTMVYPTDKTKDQVLQDIKTNFEKSFSNFQILDTKSVDKYSSIITKIKYSGSDMTGVLSINGDGKNYFVSGFAAPRDQLKDSLPNLMKTLASFSYDTKLMNPSSIKNLVQMVSYKDSSEGAFSVDVPSGWKINAGVVRPYIDAALKIIVTSGDMGVQIENPYPPIYTMPNQILSFAGFPEGSHYNPSGGVSQDTIVMSEKTAQNYIETTLATTLGLKVDSVTSRDDLVAKIPQPSYITQTTAAEATLSGDGKVHKVIVVEQGLSAAGMGIWTAGLAHYWAPASEIAKVEEIATAMDRSFKLDPTWAKNEQAEVAKRSKIISQNGSEIADIINSTFEYRSSSQDKLADKWSDAILGVQDVYNPSTGENYTVPNTSKYYWTDGLNSVVGTDTHQSPGYYWDWQELTPVN
ncbi:MAG: hypothetical protein Q7R60_03370 [bacterium]|nr:hypothetical protein [bacterium]